MRAMIRRLLEIISRLLFGPLFRLTLFSHNKKIRSLVYD